MKHNQGKSMKNLTTVSHHCFSCKYVRHLQVDCASMIRIYKSHDADLFFIQRSRKIKQFQYDYYYHFLLIWTRFKFIFPKLAFFKLKL